MAHNRHALIDVKTGLVTNVVIWEGAEWTPPRNHYVVNTLDGQIGDYWDQANNCFYTFNGKKRFVNEKGKCGELELSPEESELVKPHLDKVYAKMRQQVQDATLALEKKEQ